MLPVLRLPAQGKAATADAAHRMVGDVLRLRLGEFLSGIRPDDPVAVHGQVSADPVAGVGVLLRLAGQPATVAGHEARCRDLLAGLADFATTAARTDAHAGPRGSLTWRLHPGPDGRLPGRGIACWPEDGLRWAALLDAVDRTAGACGVDVTLAPLTPPRSALPVLRRTLRRTAAPAAASAALDALDHTPVAFTATLTLRADDPAVAGELAAALGVPDLTPEPAHPLFRPGGLEQVRNGSVVAPRTAAGLLPLAALPSDAVTRHPRRPAVVSRYAPDPEGAGVRLGRSAGNRPYDLRVPDLNQHLLVTGLTGFGKTTTVMTLLRRLWADHTVPYLVIDPEKTEYLAMTGARSLRLGRDGAQINPLAVPEGVDAAAFADIVAECLDAATGLSATWPFAAAALRNAVTDLYQDDDPPTVATLYRAVLEQACTHGGVGEQAANLRASLGQRVQSLLAGAGGDALAGGADAGLDWAQLLAEPAVISLAGFGDRAARQLAFGLLLAGLVAYRRAHPLPAFGHVAVLEEAHLLLGGASAASPHDGKPSAAEATATAIATQRSYGQGFILVTQNSAQLPDAVTGLFPNLLTHRGHPAPGRGAMDQVAEQVSLLGRGEAFIVTAGGSHADPVWVAVDPDLPSSVADTRRTPEVPMPVQAAPPERIWCPACPHPCVARHWLPLAPEVEDAIADLPSQLQAEAALAALGDRVVRDDLRFGPDELHAGFYCVIARALTRVRAHDRRGAAAAVREARRIADRVAHDSRDRGP